MSSSFLVSVVTPSFNQARFLEETLASVFGQDYPHIEYLVMDGGSTDASTDILNRYSERLAYWESQPDQGQAHAINKGLERARGEILGWLNSDDVLLPETVRRAVDVFKTYPEVDVVYGRLDRINARGELIPTPVLPKDKVVFSKKLVIGECVVNQPGAFWRRRIMERVGFLNQELVYTLDYEYWIRMALAGANFLRLPETVARFRLSSASKTVGQTAQMAVEQWNVLENLLAQNDLPERLAQTPAQIQRQARKARGMIALHASYGYLKLRKRDEAWRWLIRALDSDPAALFRRRWIDLALASLFRRF